MNWRLAAAAVGASLVALWALWGLSDSRERTDRTAKPPALVTPPVPPGSAAIGREAPIGPPAPLRFGRVPGVTTASATGPLGAEGIDRWANEVPGVQDVRIPSTLDGEPQPALWLPSDRQGPRPLLVVLHSWSSQYTQHLGLVFADWAQRNGWSMIAPNFRGINTTAAAAGSEGAVRDVTDAIAFAARRGADPRRAYTIGFSGGGMMSLLMAGRHPDRIAGAVSWVPVHDLPDWHAYNASQVPRRDYADHMEAACGGDPQTDRLARAECRRRSPSRYLANARRAGVPVYLGHGLQDDLVRPDAALRAFNQLADPPDRLGPEVLESVEDNALPGRLAGTTGAPAYFGRGDPEVVFSRRSGRATVALFSGEHDMVFHPGLEWIVRTDHARRRGRPAPASD